MSDEPWKFFIYTANDTPAEILSRDACHTLLNAILSQHHFSLCRLAFVLAHSTMWPNYTWGRSSLRPLQQPVADCSARCTCLASQLMYAADAYPQANPAPAQGLPWHALLHTSRLAFHILTAGTLVACSRAWPGHQRSVLNPLAPFSFVPPVAVGARFYRARCLGVALYLSYSLRFVTLSLCDGDEASPSVLSVEPALCRSALHPPPPPPPPPPFSRGRWQPCSARGTGFASPPQCRSKLNLAADSAWVRLRLRCSVLHVLVRHSRRYRLPDTRLVIHGGQGWAIPTQCWARSVPFSTALLLKSGWQIRSARCPDPALPSPVAGNARANSRVPCPHVSYMCYILFLLRLAHPLVAPHWNWGRFICTQCGARALLFSTALPIHQAADCSARSRYPDLAFPAQTQVAVAHPWGRSCHSSAAPSPGNSTTSARLTFTSALIRVTSHLQHWAHRVTSHLQRRCVIHTHCRYRSLNPTQARCLLHLAAVATSICSIHYYPYFGDISAQDGRYLSCPFIWASFYWSPKKNWQGCLYRCWSWARCPSPHCGSGSTRTQGATTVSGPRFFTSIPWGIAAVFVPSK